MAASIVDYQSLAHVLAQAAVPFTAIPRLSLNSFQPFVLFYQLIQFILVSIQVLVILAPVHFVKSGHHESGIYFRMAVPYMGLQDIVWGRVFTQRAFHSVIFLQWIPKRKTHAFFVMLAKAAADCCLQLLKRL